MEIVFAVVYVNPFQNKLYSETLCPDMLYNTLVFLVNGFQQQACQRRRIVAQFLEKYIVTIGFVHCLLHRQQVIAQCFGIGTVIHIEAVKTSVIRDYRKIGFGFKFPYRCFYTQHVFRIFGFPCNKVFAAQIHIAYSGGENQVRSLIVGFIWACPFAFFSQRSTANRTKNASGSGYPLYLLFR